MEEEHDCWSGVLFVDELSADLSQGFSKGHG